jgi:predicted AlkP superfamily phosphohydrolase/phosphomutase
MILLKFRHVSDLESAVRGRRRPATALLGCLLAIAVSTPAAMAASYERVVILGFDGADAGLVEQYMAAGRLPNLARLRAEGSYSPLLSTNPPQTPVSWAAFATGLNPGRTEIFDFLRRTEGTYLPDFAMIKETRRPLLFGARNPMVFGALAALMSGAFLGLVLLILRRGWPMIVAAALIGALGGGGGAGALIARWMPHELPDAVNGRRGLPFWTVAAAAGLPVRIINVPDTFPAESHEDLAMLSGLGVPDMRGRIGSPSIFTSDPDMTIPDNQFSVEIVKLAARRGRIETAVVGPLNKPFWDYRLDEAARGIDNAEAKAKARADEEATLKARGVPKRLDVPFTLDVTDDALTLTLGGQTETLRPGDWSRWLVVPVRVNPLVDVMNGLRGIARFKLLALSPQVKLYMSPLNFHPQCQPIPFTAPRSLASELMQQVGLFKTLGWPIDTWSLAQGLTDEQLFIEDMRSTVDTQVAMMTGALDAGRDRLYVQVFDFTDRVGHMLWRLHDPGHPLYDAALAARWEPEIPKAYERMDAIVGEAMKRLRPGTALIVCSDHGFASFRRGVNYNTWLEQNGFMTLRESRYEGRSLEDLFDKKDPGAFFKYVDWSRTKAYALGLGNIYVNLLGREPKGSVAPGHEYEEVRDGIARGLESLIDPKTQEKPVMRVYRREEIYSGFDPRVIPDLRVANANHYRVGWQSTLGEVPHEVFEDNMRTWSGDHCSNDPSVVPGILFSTARLDAAHPAIGDIFPTVLALLGVPAVAGIDGRSLAPAR